MEKPGKVMDFQNPIFHLPGQVMKCVVCRSDKMNYVVVLFNGYHFIVSISAVRYSSNLNLHSLSSLLEMESTINILLHIIIITL